jgi:subtilisin family serine protease
MDNKKLGPALRSRLQSGDGDNFDINILLPQKPATLQNETKSPEQIRTEVEAKQHSLLEFLAGNSLGGTQPFWINNSVNAKVTREQLEHLLARPDVAHAELTRRTPLAKVLDRTGGPTPAVAIHAAPAPAAAVGGPPLPTWNVQKVGAPALWSLGLTGEGIVVAVIDTGVNLLHPDLKDRLWDGGAHFPFHGFNFESPQEEPRDDHGHGTSSAGLIAGQGSTVATGMAPKAKIMVLRVAGGGASEDVSEAHAWAAFQFALDHGAHVISMPLTWKDDAGGDRNRWRRVCESVLSAGVLHANSSGDQGAPPLHPAIPFNIGVPGSCPPPRLHGRQTLRGGVSSAIACGATDQADSLLPMSGRGPVSWVAPPYTDYSFSHGQSMGLLKPDLCAPGAKLTSCNWRFPEVDATNPYSDGHGTGTSAATACVAGCLALLAQACLRSGKPIRPALILEALESTAVSVAGQTSTKQNNFGAGRIDVHAAFGYGQQRQWWG